MSDFTALLIVGIVALVLGWPTWAIVVLFVLALLCALAELGASS